MSVGCNGRPPQLSGAVFELLRALIQERTGLLYGEDRLPELEDRLAPLVAKNGMNSYLDYYYQLKLDVSADWLEVHTALAIRETYFWREFDQFEAITQHVLPPLLTSARGPVRIWHAGCASGEEPYTHAMHLIRSGLIDRVEIVATDADASALQQAAAGKYPPSSFRRLPLDVLSQFFTAVDDKHRQLDADVLRRVRFEFLNLADVPSLHALADSFDIIMCRNVFLYFAPSAVERATWELYRALKVPGCLVVGAAESLLRLPVPFKLTSIGSTFAYLREEPADA